MMPSSTRALRLPAHLPVHLVLMALLLTALPLVLITPAERRATQAEHPEVLARRSRVTPRYEGGQFCEPVNRPGAVKLAQPDSRDLWSGRVDRYRTQRLLHDVRAQRRPRPGLDGRRHDSRRKAKANAFLDWLLATDRYGNTQRDGSPTRRHVHHLTTDVSGALTIRDGARTAAPTRTPTTFTSVWATTARQVARSFWTGKPLTGSCTGSLTTSAPRVVVDPMRYVPVAPTRVASTESGAGMLSLPAVPRLPRVAVAASTSRSPGQARYPDAESLRLRCRWHARPNWESSLTAGPAGGDIPACDGYLPSRTRSAPRRWCCQSGPMARSASSLTSVQLTWRSACRATTSTQMLRRRFGIGSLQTAANSSTRSMPAALVHQRRSAEGRRSKLSLLEGGHRPRLHVRRGVRHCRQRQGWRERSMCTQLGRTTQGSRW